MLGLTLVASRSETSAISEDACRAKIEVPRKLPITIRKTKGRVMAVGSLSFSSSTATSNRCVKPPSVPEFQGAPQRTRAQTVAENEDLAPAPAWWQP